MNKSELIKQLVQTVFEREDALPYLYGMNPPPNKVFYSGPFWDENEITAMMDALLFGRWLPSGENVAKFERLFSKHVAQQSSVMVNSGSSANLVLITACKKHFGWQDEDEIIVSAVGFPTTYSPIIQNGLKPVFVDIEMRTLNFDLNLIEEKITPKTKAIFLSPVLGNPCDIDTLLKICKDNDITLLLDNCDTLGSKWRKQPLSAYSFASTCSFYAAHHICTGEGGMISSNDKEFIKLCRSIAWWGKACYCVGKGNTLKNGTCGKRFSKWIDDYDRELDHRYVFTNVGYNLKPLDFQGAIGIQQLRKVKEIHHSRFINKYTLDGILMDSFRGHISVVPEHIHSKASWFGVPIICKTPEFKQALQQHFEENGIQTRNYFAGNLLRQPAYREFGNYLDYPNANKVLDTVFFIGCAPQYTKETMAYIRKVCQDFEVYDGE